jgi:hypothetical protein
LETVASRLRDVFDGVCSASAVLLVAANLVPGFDGGGDFSRGDVGHDGELVPDLFNLSAERTPSNTPSTVEGCRTGLCADSARWTAAAEGTVEKDAAVTGFRVGLNS